MVKDYKEGHNQVIHIWRELSWFHSPPSTDILLFRVQGQLVKFQVFKRVYPLTGELVVLISVSVKSVCGYRLYIQLLTESNLFKSRSDISAICRVKDQAEICGSAVIVLSTMKKTSRFVTCAGSAVFRHASL